MAHSAAYPQAPALTQDELVELFQQAELARLATHNDDGSIHVAPVYFAYEPPDIVLGTQTKSRKVRNIVRNPQVTVLIDVTSPDLMGAIVYGTAVLDHDDVVAKRTGIFRRYMDEDAAAGFARALADTWDGVVIRVRPERVASFDYRKAFPIGG